jgi:hypothetical protein
MLIPRGGRAACRVHLLVEEKVVMVANRDGGVDNLEVKGDLMLRIADADRGHIRVRLGNVNNKLFQFKVRGARARPAHPAAAWLPRLRRCRVVRWVRMCLCVGALGWVADAPKRGPEPVPGRECDWAQGHVAAIPHGPAARRGQVALPEQGGERRPLLRCGAGWPRKKGEGEERGGCGARLTRGLAQSIAGRRRPRTGARWRSRTS